MSTRHAYLSIKIDDVDIAEKPNYVTHFSYDRRTTDAGNSVQFSLYDDVAMQVEAMLVEGSDKLEISYGLTPQHARTYKAQVIDWRPRLSGWGAELEVDAITTAVAKQNNKPTATYEGSPSDIVLKVAEEEGWGVGIIEPTAEIPYQNREGTKAFKRYHRGGLSAVRFINERVLPYARSSLTGDSGYFFYFTDSEKAAVNFHTKGYKAKKETIDLTFTIGAQGSDVLEWSPNYTGAMFMASQGLIVKYQDREGLLNKIVKGEVSNAQTKIVQVSSKEEALLLADYLWELKLRYSYTGSLSVIERPHIDPWTTISLLVLTKYNVPHHTSGLYIVTDVKDIIEGGLIRSELQVLGALA